MFGKIHALLGLGLVLHNLIEPHGIASLMRYQELFFSSKLRVVHSKLCPS